MSQYPPETRPPFAESKLFTAKLYWKTRIGFLIAKWGWVRLSLVALVFFLGGGVVFWQVGWRWAESRNIAKARMLQQQGEWRGARLLLEQAVQVRPRSIPAQRALAEFWDNLRAPAAVARWREVARLSEEDEAYWKWAAAALRIADLDEARLALNTVSANGRNATSHHRLLAALALASGKPELATLHFDELVRLEPSNPRYRYNAAAHRLRMGDPGREQARRELEDLARGDAMRIRSTIDLLLDAPGRWPGAGDPVQFLALRILENVQRVRARAGQAPGLQQLVAYMKTQPSPEPQDVAVLVHWLMQNERAREALDWLDVLPESARRYPEVVAATADCAAQIRDWPRLEAALAQGAWGMISPAVLRAAFVWREKRPSGSEGLLPVWPRLVEQSQDTRAGLRILWQLARLWQWPVEAERTLGTVTRLYPQESWAWEASRNAVLARGDSLELRRLYERWQAAAPGDNRIRSERLLVAFLTSAPALDQRAEAATLFRAEPAAPVHRVIQALALREVGKGEEALALLEQPGLDLTREPRFALVYGLLLAEAGQVRRSEAALAKVTGNLLPEERRLLERAHARNARGR